MNISFVCLHSARWQEKPSLFLKNPYHHCLGLKSYIAKPERSGYKLDRHMGLLDRVNYFVTNLFWFSYIINLKPQKPY